MRDEESCAACPGERTTEDGPTGPAGRPDSGPNRDANAKPPRRFPCCCENPWRVASPLCGTGGGVNLDDGLIDRCALAFPFGSATNRRAFPDWNVVGACWNCRRLLGAVAAIRRCAAGTTNGAGFIADASRIAAGSCVTAGMRGARVATTRRSITRSGGLIPRPAAATRLCGPALTGKAPWIG